MKVRFLILLFGEFLACGAARCQAISAYEASDPALVRSYVGLDIESYFFQAGTTFYTAIPSYHYAVPNGRHLFMIGVPFLHTIFPEDLAGYENTTGIGDLRMRYMAVPFIQDDPLGLRRFSVYGELTAPTGEYILGRGAGTWIFKPGMIATVQAAPEVALYPELQLQFSASESNTLGGGQAVSDPASFERDSRLQNVIVHVPAVIVMDAANSWFTIDPEYIHSINERVGFFFVQAEVGRTLGNLSSMAINISRFIAGQPRLSVIVRVRFQFYLR